MAQPVRFETIEKALKLDPGTVEKWSAEAGFPLAGAGVAVVADVFAWRKGKDSPEFPPAATLGSVTPPAETPEQAETSIVWVTIRVPLLVTGATLPGSNPVQALRIASSERHIKDTWGKVLHGCRAGSVRMKSGRVVKTSADSLKFLFEQICDAIAKV